MLIGWSPESAVGGLLPPPPPLGRPPVGRQLAAAKRDGGPYLEQISRRQLAPFLPPLPPPRQLALGSRRRPRGLYVACPLIPRSNPQGTAVPRLASLRCGPLRSSSGRDLSSPSPGGLGPTTTSGLCRVSAFWWSLVRLRGRHSLATGCFHWRSDGTYLHWRPASSSEGLALELQRLAARVLSIGWQPGFGGGGLASSPPPSRCRPSAAPRGGRP